MTSTNTATPLNSQESPASQLRSGLARAAFAVFLLSIPGFLVTDGKGGAWIWILIWPASWAVGRRVVFVDADAGEVHTATET